METLSLFAPYALLLALAIFIAVSLVIVLAQLAEDFDVRPMTEAELDAFFLKLRPPER